MTPAEAYKLTLREIVLFAEGRKIAERGEYRDRIDQAYLTARLGKVDPKRFPDSPSKFYPRPPLTAKQRAEENAARMRNLRDARNATLKPKKHPGKTKPAKKKKK